MTISHGKTLINSCFVASLLLSGYSSSANDEKDTKVETRLFVGQDCLLSDNGASERQGAFLGVLLKFVVPFLVEKSIDLVTNELTKIKKAESVGDVYTHLYEYNIGAKVPTWNPQLSCYTAVTGKFIKGDSGLAPGDSWNYDHNVSLDNALEKPRKSHMGVVQRLKDNEIELIDDEYYSVFEIKVEDFEEDVSDGTAFRLKSRYFHAPRLLNNRSTAGQVYTWKIGGPGTSPNKQIYALATIDLGDIKRGKEITRLDFSFGKIKGHETGLIAQIGMSKTSLEKIKTDPTGCKGIEDCETTVKALADMDAKLSLAKVALLKAHEPTNLSGFREFLSNLDTVDCENPDMEIAMEALTAAAYCDHKKMVADASSSLPPRNYTPAVISMTNTQTKKPSDAAKLVAALLSGAKESISAAAKEAITPVDQEQLATNILDAEIAVATAVAEYAAATTDAAKNLADLKHQKACSELQKLDETAICTAL